MFVTTLTIVLIVNRLVGLGMAIDAVMNARTPQGTIAWIVALILLPELAVPFYLIFGNRRFVGYVKARRRKRGRVAGYLDEALNRIRPEGERPPRDGGMIDAIATLTPVPPTTGNHVDVYEDGNAAFDAMIDAINNAKHSVVAEFYIVRDDNIGQRFAAALAGAGRRGLRVALLYDGIASAGLTNAYFERLQSAGVLTQRFGARAATWRKLQLNFRNHRKMLVIDGERAFVGGLNVGDEYVGKHPVLSPWRDTHVQIQGRAALAVQLVWLEDWCCSSAERPELAWPVIESERCCEVGDARVLIMPTSAADELETGTLLFNHLFSSAKKRLWIATPYFVPDEGLITTLQLAALRGVDVRVMIPSRPDSRLVQLSAYSFFDEAIATGIKLYQYQEGFMHQKVILSDDVSAIGSANLDNRSMRINFEIMALIDDAKFAARIQEMLERDMQKCKAVARGDFAKMPWYTRFAARMARLLAPIQ